MMECCPEARDRERVLHMHAGIWPEIRENKEEINREH
jgi:hypothetical protein